MGPVAFPGWRQLLLGNVCRHPAKRPLRKVPGGDKDRRGPGNVEGLVPALVMGLNGGILAAWLGLPSLRRQQHPKRVPRPQSQHRAVPHLVPSVSQPEHPQLWRSTAPEDIHLLLLFVSPVPGRSPSTQHQCYCHLLSAALALTAAGPRVTARVGLLRTQGWQGASAQYLLLSTAPSLTQSFAQALSLSCSLTQTSYLHTVSTVEPPQSLPAAGNQHCDNFSN